MAESNPYESPESPPAAPPRGPDGSWFLRTILAVHAAVLFVVGAVVVSPVVLESQWELWGVLAVFVMAWALVFPVLALIGVTELKDRSWKARAQWSLLVAGLWLLLLFLLFGAALAQELATRWHEADAPSH